MRRSLGWGRRKVEFRGRRTEALSPGPLCCALSLKAGFILSKSSANRVVLGVHGKAE